MDKTAIEKAIKDFKFHATPSNANSSEPATVRDINNLICEISKLAQIIADSTD